MTCNYMTIEELKDFMFNEQKVNRIESTGEKTFRFQQNLSLAEVEELIKKFDQSTEGKECMEMGVDGRRASSSPSFSSNFAFV